MATAKLKKENQLLREEIAELKEKLNKVIEDVSKSNAKTKQEVGHVVLSPDKEKSVEYISNQYDDLVLFKDNTIKELKNFKSQVNTIAKKCDEITNVIEQMEDYSYQYNVKIVGMPLETERESSEQTANLCLKLFTAIGVQDMSLQEIDIAHRIPARRTTNRPNAIICKFVRRMTREKVMAARKGVANLQLNQLGFSSHVELGNINIYDHLTPRLQELLYEAKNYQKANHFKFCWAKKRCIYLRKSETEDVIKLNNLRDLTDL